MSVTCLKCGSSQIESITVPPDAQHPQSRIIIECMECGNKWDPADYERLKRQKEAADRQHAYDMWQTAFFAAVTSNNIPEATRLLQQQADLYNKFPNPTDAYNYLNDQIRKSNKTTLIIVGIFIIIVVIILSFLI